MKSITVLTILLVNICLSSFSQTPANIYTPACTSLYNSYYFSEYSSGYINDLNIAYMDAYPNAIFIGNSSGQYNCHGYAWYVTEGGGKVWIGAYAGQGEPEEEFMNDGSYIEVSTESSAQKVSYRNSDHSAITTSTPGWVESKWADGPIMKHQPSDCPFSYSNLRYHTSVQNLNNIIYSGTYTAYGGIVSAGQTAQSSNVHFKSGKSISLKPGFKVQNSSFQATIITSCWPSSGSGLKSTSYPGSSEIVSKFKPTAQNSQKEEELSNNNTIAVFPNPTTGQFVIHCPNLIEPAIIEIYNLSGRAILNCELSSTETTIDLSGNPAGVYILKIFNGQEVITKKIIKK